MGKLIDKEHVRNELDASGIDICLTRFVGPNGSRLIDVSYNHFSVNAPLTVDPKIIKEFQSKWENISITQS